MLSSSGRGVLAGGVLLAGVGWGLGYREAVVLGVAALLAVAVAALWTMRRSSVAAVREVVPAKVARGDVAQGRVTLANTGRRALRGLRAEDRVAGLVIPPVDLPAVPAGGELRARYALPTHRRGRVEIGPMYLVRGDPLGLTRRSRRHGELETLLVRPRTVALASLPAGRTHHLEGPNSDTADDGTLTFHSLREYVLGDDLRRVHWRSTARTGTMMVRTLIDVSLPQTTVVLDTGSAAYAEGSDGDACEEAFEVAVDIAASVSLAAARNNFPLRVLTGRGALPAPVGDHRGAEHWLDLLADVSASEDHSLSAAFDEVERTAAGDTLVVITGGVDTPGLSRLDRIGGRFDRVLLIRSVPPTTPDGGRNGAGRAEGTTPNVLRVAQIRVSGLEEMAVAWRKEISR
ncbi:DUF58 domain-containing protein [Embleya sp. NPDC020630]|uniref:DUF58 domain-containing protein n=1 Tax=Embleya sp. NPDC020630 TaxID=3363979 RepID=UPI0037BCB05A